MTFRSVVVNYSHYGHVDKKSSTGIITFIRVKFHLLCRSLSKKPADTEAAPGLFLT